MMTNNNQELNDLEKEINKFLREYNSIFSQKYNVNDISSQFEKKHKYYFTIVNNKVKSIATIPQLLFSQSTMLLKNEFPVFDKQLNAILYKNRKGDLTEYDLYRYFLLNEKLTLIYLEFEAYLKKCGIEKPIKEQNSDLESQNAFYSITTMNLGLHYNSLCFSECLNKLEKYKNNNDISNINIDSYYYYKNIYSFFVIDDKIIDNYKQEFNKINLNYSSLTDNVKIGLGVFLSNFEKLNIIIKDITNNFNIITEQQVKIVGQPKYFFWILTAYSNLSRNYEEYISKYNVQISTTIELELFKNKISIARTRLLELSNKLKFFNKTFPTELVDMQLNTFNEITNKKNQFSIQEYNKLILGYIDNYNIAITNKIINQENDTEPYEMVLKTLKEINESNKRILGLEKSISEIFIDNSNSVTIKENPRPDIFSSYLGYEIFCKMKDMYSNESYGNQKNKDLANFSFLFDIMKSDNYIICRNADFINYLHEFDISIGKIDSNKIRNIAKTNVYNSMKNEIEQKHKKSTI